jgi:hypothetical protein
MLPAMVLFLLLAGHAFADFACQNDYVALAKNRNTPLGKGQTVWPIVLGAHAMIHGAIVALITGSVILGICETVAHFITDFFKCEGKISYWSDQIIHVACKFAWFTIWCIFHGHLA